MIGSYITEKLKKSKNLDEIVSGLTQMNRDCWSEELDIPKVFEMQSARDWFNYCKLYGVQVAKGNRMPFSAKTASPIEIVEIIKGDITELEVDVIVNSAHVSLMPGSGVCGAIHKAAGKELEKECKTIAGDHLAGQIALTQGYNLKSRFVLHVIVPYAKEHGKLSAQEKEILINCYKEAIYTANRCGMKSIAFPSLGTGVRGYPIKEMSELAVKTVIDYFGEFHPTAFSRICFVTHSEEDYTAYQNAYKNYLKNTK